MEFKNLLMLLGACCCTALMAQTQQPEKIMDKTISALL